MTTPAVAETPPIAIDVWDNGRLLVNRDAAAWLQSMGFTTVESLLALEAQDVYRQVGERVTSRHEFPGDPAPRVVYIKRHGRITWKERIKAWTRLQTPAWGARPEWDAIVAFHQHGLPTMTPIACGEQQGQSLLMTASLEDCTRLDHWLASPESREPSQQAQRRQVLTTLAQLVRRMHAAGYHHQDLYLCHVLWPRHQGPLLLYLIDLGRVQRHARWSARRWISKDLAQLLYSAKDCSKAEQLRFLRNYLQRSLSTADRYWVRWLRWKAERIGRHTRRHGL